MRRSSSLLRGLCEEACEVSRLVIFTDPSNKRPERSAAMHAVSALRCCERVAPTHGLQQPVERRGEELDAFIEQLTGNGLRGDTQPCERLHRRVGLRQAFGQARAWTTVIAERLQCAQGERVDGVTADQLLDVEHVA